MDSEPEEGRLLPAPVSPIDSKKLVHVRIHRISYPLRNHAQEC